MSKISNEKAAMDQSLFEIRILFYYYLLAQEKNEEFQDLWTKFKIQTEQVKNPEDYFVCFDGDDKKTGEGLFVECLRPNRGKDLSGTDVNASDLLQIEENWNDVKTIIKDGKNWLNKVYEYLDAVAKKHPKIANAIVTLLLGILTGVIVDCIHDGFTMAKNNKEDAIFQEISSNELKYSDAILIKDEDGYMIIYCGENGKIVMENVSEDEVKMIESGK